MVSDQVSTEMGKASITQTTSNQVCGSVSRVRNWATRPPCRFQGEVKVGEIVEIGKGEVKKEGSDVTLVSWGRMLERALQAAEELKDEGISVEVVDPITLVPLDEKIIIESVKKTGRLVICHDSFKTGGFGGEISSRISESEAFDYLDSPIYRIAGADTNIPSAKNLEAVIVPSVEDIKNALRKSVNR